MSIYYNTKFTGQWPVGTSAIVCAHSKADAAKILNVSLSNAGLKGDAQAKDMIELNDFEPGHCIILNDGAY